MSLAQISATNHLCCMHKYKPCILIVYKVVIVLFVTLNYSIYASRFLLIILVADLISEFSLLICLSYACITSKILKL